MNRGEAMIEEQIVIRFLEQCNDYAHRSIARKKERGEEDDITQWKSYIDFNDHAIEEIKKGELRHWFEQSSPDPPTQSVDLEALEHVERSTWLTALLSPRPLSVFATKQSNGEWNLSTITSCMHVSTKPPYVLASFSNHRDGEIRDSLRHLRHQKVGTINFFSGHDDVLNIINIAARPLKFDISESEQLSTDEQPNMHGILKQSVAALEVEYVQEYDMPDAVAKLVLLRAKRAWYHHIDAPSFIPGLMCQSGIDRVGRMLISDPTLITSHYENIRGDDAPTT